MEAKLRKKNEENSALKMQLQKMEDKWREYEETMKSVEKTWQDQLTYIQNADNTTTRTGFFHGNSMVAGSLDLPSNNGSGPHITTNSTNHIIKQFEGMYDEDVDQAQVALDQVKLHPGVELQKLKLRFTAWKKYFKTRLWEAEATFKKLSHLETEKGQKRWWERRQMRRGIRN
ncbi:Hypothetical predicted protein [Olea europaea subsp. europaea]|uniref:Uncharacterized protein n=1 Tax=Olea europaea subsp. europaea TaxID=158383 RepID=A0A8S0U894_OLEEU|nr:Hypothetical predicted protein [Olea europaea subsp. europaea]